MANRALLAVGIIVIVVGVAQWVLIANAGLLLSARVPPPSDRSSIVQQSIDPGRSGTLTLITEPLPDPLYIPALAYPKFYVVVGLEGAGFNSGAAVDNIEITINILVNGQSSPLLTVNAADYIFSINENGGTGIVYVKVEIVDALGDTGYSLTISNQESVAVTVAVFEFGIRTETRNTMLVLGLIGIIMIVTSVVLKPRSSRKQRKRKAFYAMEEEPTLGVAATSSVTAKKGKKKKKKAPKAPKKVKRPSTSATSTCQYCGQSIPPNSFFCPHCYAELR